MFVMCLCGSEVNGQPANTRIVERRMSYTASLHTNGGGVVSLQPVLVGSRMKRSGHRRKNRLQDPGRGGIGRSERLV